MKPIHIIAFLAAVIVFALAAAMWKHQKKQVKKASQPNGNGSKPLATETVTTIEDPTTGAEYVVSELGENNLDGRMGTYKMESSIAAILNDIDYRTGLKPATLKLNVYDPQGKLVGYKTIGTPSKDIMGAGVPATAFQAPYGEVSYSCPSGQLPQGPGYYTNVTGETLFGLFCR